MGIVGAIGLFLSIIVHELSHSLVGRVYGMPIRGITLFIFGGVAEMNEEPVGARGEFLMAIVGPVTSLAVALLAYLLMLGAISLEWPVMIVGIFDYLAIINLVLAVFNMIPAFPLDGGRVLRAALWGWSGQYLWATRIASNFGSGFGILLIILAVFSIINGNFIGGMWWFLIGLFVRAAAQGTYQQTLMRKILGDLSVQQLMNDNPVSVPSSLSIDQLVDDFFYKHHFKMFPVVDDGKLAGCILLRDVRNVPREEWRTRTVSDVMQRCSEDNTVTPYIDVAQVLTRMGQSGVPRLAGTSQGIDPLIVSADRNLQALSPRQRQAFLLVSMEGFSVREAAEILNVDQTEVTALIDEALQDIANQISTDVLIIEDEPLVAMDLEETMQEIGHNIIGIASTHGEAVEIAKNRSPGLILADIQLADGSSGIDAVNDIVSVFQAPVIFITAFPERLLTGEKPEPAFLITKPFDPDMVKAICSQALFFDQKTHGTR